MFRQPEKVIGWIHANICVLAPEDKTALFAEGYLKLPRVGFLVLVTYRRPWWAPWAWVEEEWACHSWSGARRDRRALHVPIKRPIVGLGARYLDAFRDLVDGPATPSVVKFRRRTARLVSSDTLVRKHHYYPTFEPRMVSTIREAKPWSHLVASPVLVREQIQPALLCDQHSCYW